MISGRLGERDSVLFVYGTLRAFVDIPMAHRLRDGSRYLGGARVRGRLYDLGSYPGLVAPRTHGEWVVGDVYRVRSRLLLCTLDRYEAGGSARPRFVRVRRPIVLAGGGRGTAWLYLYCRGNCRNRRITSGDYRAYLESCGQRS